MKSEILTKQINDILFYKRTNVFNKKLIKELHKSADHLFEVNKHIGEDFPPEATNSFLHCHNDPPFSTGEECWNLFKSKAWSTVKEYASLVEINPDHIFPHTCWVTRVREYPEYTDYTLFNPLKNMHSHFDHIIGKKLIGTVYYLQNPDPKYGTLVKIKDGEFYLNTGEENTMVVFDSFLYHSAIYPPPEVVKKHPRYTIVFDFYVNEYPLTPL